MARIDATLVLLQALLAGPGYGLNLMLRIAIATGDKLHLSQGAAYAALRAMEAKGLVVGVEVKGMPGGEPGVERGRPPRLFQLTAQGRKAALRDRTLFTDLLAIPVVK